MNKEFKIAKHETEKLKEVRNGKDYHRILSNISVNIMDDFVVDVQKLRDSDGSRLTLFSVGCLMIRYELNCSAICKLLEWHCGAPKGIYQHLKDRGLKVGEMLESVMNDPKRLELPFELKSRYQK